MKPAKGLRPVISAEPLGWFQSLLARSARRDRYAEPQRAQNSRSRPHSGLKRLIGLDTGAEDYRYAVDPEAGYVSAKKVADRWVATTCGYCSVGCGMLVGVKDGRAVSVRGNPDHPVNRGVLCPKGLSEHHTLYADNRALYPMLRRDRRGVRARVSWDVCRSFS